MPAETEIVGNRWAGCPRTRFADDDVTRDVVTQDGGVGGGRNEPMLERQQHGCCFEGASRAERMPGNTFDRGHRWRW